MYYYILKQKMMNEDLSHLATEAPTPRGAENAVPMPVGQWEQHIQMPFRAGASGASILIKTTPP